ncbi:MAG: hypothetical protein AAGA77_19120 [Bacteroidota bacterium]
MENQTTAEITNATKHYHDVTLVKGKIKNIGAPNIGKLCQLEIEDFENETFYFYEGTLGSFEIAKGQEICLGRVPFSIGNEFSTEAFGTILSDGYLLFYVDVTQVKEQNLNGGENSVFSREYIASPSEQQKLAGTKACAPCKFFFENKLIGHTYKGRLYYPMVTFPDQQIKMKECYLSFFKCETKPGILNNAYPGFLYGFSDEPIMDANANVFVHQKIS